MLPLIVVLCIYVHLLHNPFINTSITPNLHRVYGDAVDFDSAVQLDDKALSAVDQFRVDEICALGIDLNDHIRRLYFEAARIVDIGHHDGSIFSGHCIKALVEELHAVIRHTAAGENGLHFILIQYHGFGIFLMFLGNLIHFLMNVLYRFDIAGVAQCLFHQ